MGNMRDALDATRCVVAAVVLFASAAPASPSEEAATPYLRVLGTAQDGGVPHAACYHEICRRARAEPQMRRLVASLAVVLPRSGKVHFVDASPDFREQLDLVADIRRPPDDRVDRDPIDGVLLTHAHMGHYLGLAFLGYEAVSSPGTPVDATPRMAEFLRRHAPWSELVRRGNIVLRERPPGVSFGIGDGVTATPLKVPHRDELSDTVGWKFEGPNRTVLYVPDTDTWATWNPSLLEVLAGVDVALLDATFFSLGELPGRSLDDVPHPLVRTSMDLLEGRVREGLDVRFTHLNHSNPALDPGSPERAEIERRGFRVLAEGDRIDL